MTYVLHPEGTPAREAQDLAFLDHLVDHHGLTTMPCPECDGDGCGKCSEHGILYSGWSETACGPDCFVPDRFEILRRLRAS
jgi:hypothetical protein